MKTLILIFLFIFFSSSKFSFSQCAVNVSGGDFAWCMSCEGAAYAYATGGTAPYTYSWSTGDTTASIDSLCAGNYIVTITDDLGCVATDSVTINQIGTPMNLNMTSTAASCSACCNVCINPNLTGGCAPYTAVWTPDSPNWPSPCGACPFETYSVTITDDCGCTVVDSIMTDTVTTVGLENIILQNSINIYPNPSSEFLTIDVTNYSSTIFATITDIYGNVVLTNKIDRKSTTIITRDLSTGVYFINIIDGKKIIQKRKWIKQ